MPKPRAVIDTNVLIFDTFMDSEHYREASSLLDSMQEWLIPSLVVHEYVWALRGLRLSFEEARRKILEYILDPRAVLVPIELGDILFSLREIENFDKYNDLTILSIALRTVRRLATFDRELRRRASNTGVQLLP
ncbi:MAG: PIN domain-containing protein [Candidatus Nezhaarchaeales archaeon]